MMCRCHRYGTVMISPDCEGTILACLLSYVMLVLHILGQAAPELYSNKCETMAQKSCLLSSLTIVQVSSNCEELGYR